MAEHAEVIGDYVVLDTLGAGAVGTAYHARHLHNGDLVALKLMHDRLASDPEVQKRFVREVSVLEKLEHPNIVRHLDCGLDDGRIYFAMEWVDFGTLSEILKTRRKLPWRETVECAIQICRGLAHAHQRGIVHRDLKPDNLFLSSDGRLKIGDFGLARDANLHRLTDEGNTVGTCRYMAPEQVRGAEHLTGGVDLYALGCLMYRMLTGEVPYDGATVIEIFEKHLYDNIPSVCKRLRECPPELDDLVTRLLAKDPAERPADAAEVEAALQAILDGGQVDTDFTTGQPAEYPDDASPATDSPSPPERNPTERNLTERLATPTAGEGSGRYATWALLAGIALMLIAITLLALFRE